MKKSIVAAVALVALASCSKENATTDQTTDQATDLVAATFTSAAITRVADNAWVANDKIGITMVEYGTYTLTDGAYENVPHTVSTAGESGTFSPDDTIIYFPLDDSEVDFYAYYPHSTVDADKNIEISVADQSYEHIDIVAAKAEKRSKTDPTVTFSDTEAFAHQLSKLTLIIKAGDGIDDLTDLTTTIKGQYTTAKFNIYTFAVSDEGGKTDEDGEAIDITLTTTLDSDDKGVAYTSAILIPTSAIDGSTIDFVVGDNTYTLDTSSIAFVQGIENIYTVTINRTEATISGAIISGWGNGTEGENDGDDELNAGPVTTN